MTRPNCICCGSDAVVSVGKIPSAIYFAGRRLGSPLNGGALFECGNCGLSFRYPRLDKSELDALYRQGDIENWQSASAARADWRAANQWISQYSPTNGNILDVGCFDGEFLRFAGSEYKQFGIELHEAAGEKAQDSGIRVIGTDFDDLQKADADFDVVTAFDVIEHTHEPFVFLADLARVTRENGIIIVSTGNSDAHSWRLMGAAYWYCSIGEHLSFINPRWCNWAAPRLGIELKYVIKFSHMNGSWWKRISDTAKNLVYVTSPRGFSLLRTAGLGSAEYRQHEALSSHPPSWMSAKDHFICLFINK